MIVQESVDGVELRTDQTDDPLVRVKVAVIVDLYRLIFDACHLPEKSLFQGFLEHILVGCVFFVTYERFGLSLG